MSFFFNTSTTAFRKIASSIIPATTVTTTTTAAGLIYYQYYNDNNNNYNNYYAKCEKGSYNGNLQRKMTAIGHFSVTSETIWNPSIVTFFMEINGKLTGNELIDLWNKRNMNIKHPRFHQIINEKNMSFVEEATTVKDHIQETIYPINHLDLQKRIQHLQLQKWDLSNSLWQIYIATTSNNSINNKWKITSNSTAIDDATTDKTIDKEEKSNGDKTMLLFRGHHALADGASMGAALSDLFDEATILRDMTIEMIEKFYKGKKKRSLLKRFLQAWIKLFYFIAGTIKASIYQMKLFIYKLFFDKDPWKQIKRILHTSSKDTVQPRTISWSEVATIEQIKWIAEVLSNTNEDNNNDNKKLKTNNITVNDIFVTCITGALMKQLQYHRYRIQLEHNIALPKQNAIHVAVPVHLKGGIILPNESVGNNIGAFVARVPGEMNNNDNDNNDPVERLLRISKELHTIKRTPAALLSNVMAKTMSYASSIILPVSWTSKLYELSNAGSLVAISNNRGSPIPVHMNGNQVQSMYGFVPLPPGIPIGVVILSYAGKINCTVTAESWAIPNGDQFMIWILEEYLHLLNAAKMKSK